MHRLSLPLFAVLSATLLMGSQRTSDAVIVRGDCFGSIDEGVGAAASQGLGFGYSGRGSAGGASRPARSNSKNAPTAVAESAPPPAPMPAPSPMAFESADADVASATRAPLPEPEGWAMEDAPIPTPFPPATRRGLDWGGSTFLSNDDSMSLASAQRVLYALQNHRMPALDQIRPHELLNYFSFYTSEPRPGQLFDIAATGQRNGDQLTVALAVQGATPKADPLDLTLLVDRSGSMDQDGRMDYTQRGLKRMAEQLSSGDRVDIVLFDSTVCTPLENFVVGRDDPRLLTQTIERIAPRGATDLNLGLKEAYGVARRKAHTQGRNRRVMLLTDAQLNTGMVNPHTVTEIGKSLDDEGIRLTGIGVGHDFRDDVLDMLTEKGKGAYVYLGSEAVVDRVFGIGFPSLVQTIAHNVQFELKLPPSLALERFYGEEASTNAADIQPIHYYAGTSQIFLQDLAIHPDGLRTSDTLQMVVRYDDPQTGKREERTFQTSVGTLLGASPHNVDKAQALMAFTDVLQVRAMGGDACGAPAMAYATEANALTQDAEIAFVNGLFDTVCPGFEMARSVASVPYKVRVDSDVPLTHVRLACGSSATTESLSASDTVARFDATPGACTLFLGGVVDMPVAVDVPATGGQASCVVRAGLVRCGT